MPPAAERAPARAGRWRARLAVLLGLLPAPGLAQDAAPVPCAVTRVARVPLRDDGGYLSVPVSIAGRTARGAYSLVVDTGAEGGLVSARVAQALGLAVDSGRSTVLYGTGGAGGMVPNVLIAALRLNTEDGQGLDLGPLSTPVGELPGQPMITPPVAGLLGGDVLSRFDLEFDVAGGWLSLWRVQGEYDACRAAPAWRGAYGTVKLLREGHRVAVEVELDGRPLTALVDSGARSRILSIEAAKRAGVSEDRLAADPGGETSGVDGRPVLYHWHRFGSLRVGAEVEQAPVLTVSRLRDRVDMLLGADWFARHDVWISYATGRMFTRPARR
ncbi:pepsin/retropepsin-like aspartic protease family protein [Gluconacetobacter takamatsuzukensis]|uniref:pepsin/retropepsin-like aspartic protease family protein n=1 Tax=Gluconacetobacter takamatsuzukensis TaxID=1286190 RepID=UPI001FE24B2C|nr:pepsin/retropepsin-like aspartic protease family protein [Gluconacetobacter takamatsuzukensis]